MPLQIGQTGSFCWTVLQHWPRCSLRDVLVSVQPGQEPRTYN